MLPASDVVAETDEGGGAQEDTADDTAYHGPDVLLFLFVALCVGGDGGWDVDERCRGRGRRRRRQRCCLLRDARRR